MTLVRPSKNYLVRGKVGFYEVLIGLEVHAQILSSSKLFSNSPSGSLGAANSCVSLFDIGIPGCLPQLGRVPVEQAVRAAIALHCKINQFSTFERKHYFYQDLPLGYQITQQKVPIAESGHLFFDVKEHDASIKHSLPVERIQIEQDSGKSIHDAHPTLSLIDFNRAGCGLIEMVFSPTLHSAAQAGAAIRTLQQLLRHIGVCDGNMETGSLRCDVNISVRKVTESEISDYSNKSICYNEIERRGERVEIKNVSSVQRVMQAIDYESQRQVQLLESEVVSSMDALDGSVRGKVRRETRGFDPTTGTTFHLRDKETAVDYRFFPDPDLPVLYVTNEDIDRIKRTFPELPEATITRLKLEYGLDDYQAHLLLSQQGITFYEKVVRTVGADVDPLVVFNWLSSELLGLLNILNLSFKESPISSDQLAQCLLLLKDKTISGPQCKHLLKLLFHEEKGASPDAIVLKKGWKQITNDDEIRNICENVVNDMKYGEQLQKYISGKKNMDQFFFGEIMRRSNGQANPHTVREVLKLVLISKIK